MINRANYEEYFLLYVDSELTIQQQREVEQFVQYNPDVATEFAMLKQAKLTPEKNIVFVDKKLLLKNNEPEITFGNCEEYFLLKIDNELNEKEIEAVEKFIMQHPLLQHDFNLLNQAVLRSEKIEFPDKSSLYKTEKKERKFIPVNFMKLTVAAVLTGLALFIWLLLPSDNPKATAILKPPQTINLNKENNTTALSNNSLAQKQAIKNSVTVNQSSQILNKTKPQTFKKVADIKQKISLVNNEKVLKNKDFSTDKKQKQVVNQLEDVQAGSEQVSVKNNSEITLSKISSLPLLQEADIEKTKTEESDDIANIRNSLAQEAAYKELNTTDNDPKTLYVGSMEINKEKVKGLLKKASRIFSGKARDVSNDDGKLQVANLQINTQKL